MVLDRLKQLAWISFGGLAVGTLIRHGQDALRGIPNLTDAPVVDLDSILLGGSFILLWIWLMLTVLAIVEHKPWTEAKEHWIKTYPGQDGKLRPIFLLIRCYSTFTAYLWIYFAFALCFCLALTSGNVRDTFQFFLGWCLLVFSNWFFFIGTRKKWFSKEPDTLEANTVKLLDLPESHGHFVVVSIIAALIFAALGYGKVSQDFGGGKPERVVVFLKPGQSADLPSQVSVEGKVVNLVFRRGSKFGFRASDSSDGHILVIDQDKIDRLYVGNRIDDLDLSKLK
jgi:hypothetical protein